MLVFSFDPGGLDSVEQPITSMPSADFRTAISNKEAIVWPDITSIDYAALPTRIQPSQFRDMSVTIAQEFMLDANTLSDYCPFKTVVLDSLSTRNDALLEFIAGLNSCKQLQIQHWGQLGAKSQEVDTFLLSLPCNYVLIAHENVQKDEKTGEIRVIPMTYGQYAEKIGLFFSQVFYATTETDNNNKSKAVLYTAPRGLVKGIGARFPHNLPEVVGPTYEEIYGL
jgi:hypothetical protein